MAATSGNRLNGARRAQKLLSGKLRCGSCGHDFIVVDKHHHGCTRARSAGTCDNKTKIKRCELDGRVLEGIKHGLINANFLTLFQREVEAKVAEATRTQSGERKKLQRDLALIEKKLGNLTAAVANGGAFETPESWSEEVRSGEGRAGGEAGGDRHRGAADQLAVELGGNSSSRNRPPRDPTR